MRPQFEHVSIPKGCSIRVFNRQIPEIPFEWHHHPECELTLTLNSHGLRFIADHIGAYHSHDLVLLPSEMPHTWASTKAIDDSSPHVAIVLWFTESWAHQLADVCPEYSCLRRLLKRAVGGLSFPTRVGEWMESRLPGLLSDSSRERLRSALDVLTELSEQEGIALATPQKSAPITADESAQLNRILTFLHKRFADPIRMQDVCGVGNLSERSLHRLFIRHLGENLTEYLGRLRLGRACMWLVETDRPISLIAADAGFSNLSNFNRRFRAARHMSPKEFRSYYAKHGRMPDVEAFDLKKRSPSLENPKRPTPRTQAVSASASRLSF